MTSSRVTQVAAETILSGVYPNVRVSQTAIEIIVSPHTSLKFKIDSILLKTNHFNFSVDADLLFRNSKTYQVDAHFNPTRVWSVDVDLKKTQTINSLIDIYIVNRRFISHSVDVHILPTISYSIDAVLKKSTQIWFNVQSIFKKTEINSYQADAMCVNRYSISYSIDSLFYIPNIKSHSVDTLLLSHSKLTNFVDVNLLKTEVHYYQTDAQLKKQTTVQIDSVLKKTEFENYLVDSILKTTFKKTYLVDASLPKRTNIYFNIDSYLFKGLSIKIDSYITKRQHANHSVDCMLESLVGADVIATASSEGRKVSQQIEVRIEELQMKARSVKIVSYLLY